jgi:superfamily II DNA/RNA helicase
LSSFDRLEINDFFTEKLKGCSIINPTTIQNLVIPYLLERKSIVFRSETGTGKTFAYLLPVLQKLTEDVNANNIKELSVLICAPTLELCSQIKAEIDFLWNPVVHARTALFIGSVKIDKQTEMLKKLKPVIAVGSPGRILVLYKMGKIKFHNLQWLILDEADRMTAQESFDETKELLEVIERSVKNRTENGKKLCSAACSATVSKKTCIQLGKLFESAQVIETDDNEILKERIEHWAIFSEMRRKIQCLRSLLAALKAVKTRIKVLVFTSRNDEAEKILSQLRYHNVKACCLSGKIKKKPLTGAERKAAFDSFKNGNVEVLVSTDLAARGLDIPSITHVIAMDVPSDSEIYIHRCGRTGRAGKSGIMITIGCETQMHLLASLEKKLKIKVQPKELYEGRVCIPEM